MNRDWYVSDFETTSYDFYEKNGYTRVWLWATCDSNAIITKIGTDINEYIDSYCRTIEGSIIYFHNLKFDGNFIIDYFNARRKSKTIVIILFLEFRETSTIKKAFR